MSKELVSLTQKGTFLFPSSRQSYRSHWLQKSVGSKMITRRWDTFGWPLGWESRDWNSLTIYPCPWHVTSFRCVKFSPFVEGSAKWLSSTWRVAACWLLLCMLAGKREYGIMNDSSRENSSERSLHVLASSSTSSPPMLSGCPIWQPLAQLLLCFHLSNLSGTSGTKAVKCGCFFHISPIAANVYLETEMLEDSFGSPFHNT